MKGKYEIEIFNRNIKYHFEVRRNITILKGDSGTGKTSLINMIFKYKTRDNIGITIKSDCNVDVIYTKSDFIKIEELKNSIIFIDEDIPYIYSTEFAKRIKKSDNYYVIITRDPMNNIPYSINEIYEIYQDGKVNKLRKLFQKLMDASNYIGDKFNKVFTEDSNSGFEFYSKLLKDFEVKSLNGKDNISVVNDDEFKNSLVILDSAAIGNKSDRLEYLMEKYNTSFFLEESFEYLILKSGIIKDKMLNKIIGNEYDFIDSCVYFSWELFFEDLLKKLTSGGKLKSYKKSKLADYYLNGKVFKDISEKALCFSDYYGDHTLLEWN